MSPPEWVDWQHISECHKYVQVNNEPTCTVCGRDMSNHWFPKKNPQVVLDEAIQTVEDYLNRQILE